MSTNYNAFHMLTLQQASPAGGQLRLHLAGRGRMSGGGADYETVSRPRRRAVLNYNGQGLATLELPLVLDGFELFSDGTSRSVERECDVLWRWTQYDPAVRRSPTITVAGPVNQPPYRPQWTVAVEWEDEVRNEAGERVQQWATVTLTEFAEAEVLLGPAAAARARAGL